jgi:beta-glucanase (GH16 family)
METTSAPPAFAAPPGGRVTRVTVAQKRMFRAVRLQPRRARRRDRGPIALVLLLAVGVAGFAFNGGDTSRTSALGTVLRATAAPTPVVDASGKRWAAHLGSARGVRWSGGRIACSPGDVYRTASPDLYRCTAVGIHRMTMRVPHGTYGVTLFFAETLGNGPGSRVFDVDAEGRRVASAIDVVEEAGPRDAAHAVFTARVTDGVLDLGFHTRRGAAILSAVEVTRMRPSTERERLVWADQFGGLAGSPPDPRTWSHDVGGNPANKELETYTQSTRNASLDGHGHLAIVARRRSPGAHRGGFTSTRITTHGRFAFRYGTFEARVKVPAGRGLWPAFWALGDNLPREHWPKNGEFDVMEVIGSKPSVVYGSIHGPQGRHGDYAITERTTSRVPLNRGFHVFGALRIPGAIQFELDGRPYGSVTRADLPAAQRWVFESKFFLLLNLAVGGTWPGSPDASTRFPAVMLVDWVRVTR